MFGMKVRIVGLDKTETIYRNVMQVHYGYPTVLGECSRIAFESDIHGTGCTNSIGNIIEMEITLEKEMSEEF